MKFKHFFYGITAATLIANPAFADKKFSVDILAGSAKQTTNYDDLPIDDISDRDTSLGIRLGYQFNQYIAAEVSYQDYGKVDDEYIDDFGDTINETLETTALTLGAKGMLPIGNDFSLIGRLGVARWDYETQLTDSAFPGQVFSDDDDGVELYYGVGAQYNINESLFVGAEYTVFEADLDIYGTSASNDVKNLAISVGMKF